MAGYHVYSLDWRTFKQFVEKPSEDQLLTFAKGLSDRLDRYDDQFAKDDPLADWPVAPKDLVEIVRQRVSLGDWYGDLSQDGKAIIEGSVIEFAHACKEMDVRHEIGDSIYWDVITVPQHHYGIKPDTFTEKAISEFGHRPFRYHPPLGYRPSMDEWHAWHSMHEPGNIVRLIAELHAAEAAIEADEDARRDFEELMPALERIAKEQRMLFVEVET